MEPTQTQAQAHALVPAPVACGRVVPSYVGLAYLRTYFGVHHVMSWCAPLCVVMGGCDLKRAQARKPSQGKNPRNNTNLDFRRMTFSALRVAHHPISILRTPNCPGGLLGHQGHSKAPTSPQTSNDLEYGCVCVCSKHPPPYQQQ